MGGIRVTGFLLSAVIVLSAALPSLAQTPWQFRWQKGLVLTYKIKHVTSVVEIVGTSKNSSNSNLDLVNRWMVSDIDAKGVSPPTLALVSMRNEQKRGDG